MCVCVCVCVCHLYHLSIVCAQLLSRDWLFCDPMDCSPPGSSVHGIFQARILEQVAISSFRGLSQPRDRSCVSCVFCIGVFYLSIHYLTSVFMSSISFCLFIYPVGSVSLENPDQLQLIKGFFPLFFFFNTICVYLNRLPPPQIRTTFAFVTKILP